MPFIKLSFFTLLLLVNQSTAWAEEKAEGGGEGAKAEVPRDQREFAEKQAKLTTLQNRLEEADKKFKELVVEKAEAKSTEAKQAIIKEMVEITNQRNKDAEAFNKVKTDLTYRYPHEGVQLERHYKTQSRRSIEEMEGAAGLDEMLTHTKRMVDKKYAPFLPSEEKEAAAQTKKAALPPPPAQESGKHLRLEK